MQHKSIAKIVSLILSVTVFFSIFCAMNIFSGAVSYSSVNLDIPRISQRPNTGDCAIASMATVEAYMYGMPSGDYNSSAYQQLYAANGYSISANWTRLGFEKINGFDMQTIYNQLVSGYPAIVHRSSSHYSVIYGYNGSSSSLELSGFLICDVDDSYSNTSSRKTLDSWKRGYSLDQMVIRRDGLAMSTGNLTITANHPPKYLVAGKAFASYGMITSRYNITSVTMSIKDSSGNVAKNSTYSATPNSTSFAVSRGDSNMNFSKLSSGAYKYTITAKDSSGKTATYTYDFNVVGNNSDVPANGTDKEDNAVVVSYNGVVTADPSLNLRNGSGLSYTVLTSIPLGVTVQITAESNGWGKTSYSGKTGWVSLDYIDEEEGDSFYIRTTSVTSLRGTASVSGEVITDVPKNTVVQATDESNGLIKVVYNGKTGWVLSSAVVKNIGDINGSGSVDSSDALAILMCSLDDEGFSLLQKQVADINGDGEVNSADALLILQLITK